MHKLNLLGRVYVAFLAIVCVPVYMIAKALIALPEAIETAKNLYEAARLGEAESPHSWMRKS